MLEPTSRPFIPNWHIDAMAEHLEAVTTGEIQKLVINIPPGHMKSLMVSVLWQAWEWTRRPETRWLTASYAQGLSIRDSVKTRRVIQSPWYQAHWGDVFHLATDQNQKHRFENDRSGVRIATSVEGAATGERCDRAIIDDPHNVRQALSDKRRTEALLFWDETMTTRIDDPLSGGQVIVMQRLHQRDLAGHVLADGGYVHLMLPMEYEPERRCITAIGFKDPRRKDAELLWPARFGPEALSEWKRRLGSYATAGQLQQRPAPRGGGMFKRHWFAIVDAAPAEAKSARYWDMAATAESTGADPDWTVGAKAALLDGVYYITDIRRVRASPLGVEKLVCQTAELDGIKTEIGMEQEPGASGKSVIDHYARTVLLGFAFRGDRVSGAKIERANPLSAAAEAGNVKLVRGDWNKDFLDEIEIFPNGAHDDQVDAVTGAFHALGAPEPFIYVGQF